MPRFDSLHAWLAWQEALHPLGIDLGLDRVAGIFCKLNPSYVKPLTVTVAGTNGKGSSVAYLEAIYRSQGYCVGAYTSPHILRYNERIRINGEPVSDDEICESFARIDSVRDATLLSYFEFGTLAALDVFQRNQVDIQLLEVGLGGRLDAVNFIDADIALVSSIAIDHVEWLGDTREAIGREKAGIFRANTPAIIGDLDPPESLIQMAEEIGAPLLRIDKDFGYKRFSEYWEWFGPGKFIGHLPNPALKGDHQYRNASSVLMVLTQLADNVPVTDESIKQGLENVRLPGRFQFIDAEIPVLIDVGHNPQAVSTLVEHVRTFFSDKRIHAIFAIMKDKDITGVLEIMESVVHDWFFVSLSNPRAASEDLMREKFQMSGISKFFLGYSCFAEAFSAVKSQSCKGDLILVFGSFFLVSECLVEFESK